MPPIALADFPRPIPGAALLDGARAAIGAEDRAARQFWLLVSDARCAFRDGRSSAALFNLAALRRRHETALAAGESAWANRYRRALDELIHCAAEAARRTANEAAP